jgi:putative oxidoreductase
LLLLRVLTGTFMAGHGAQKLFGYGGGPGIEGTAGMMESLGLKPGKPWAALAGVSEFGGGALTALGLMNPLGPLGVIGAMSVATHKVHGIDPIWGQEGGPELPVTNSAIAAAIALSGPGRYSLDRMFGIRLPRWVVVLALALGAVAAYSSLTAEPDASGEGEGSGEES